MLTVNDLLIQVLWVFAARMLLYKSAFGQYLLLFLLVLSVAGIIRFGYTIGDTEYSGNTNFRIGSLSFDPMSFLLLLLFVVVNRKSIRKLILSSVEERESKSKKLVDFYYIKFSNAKSDELEGFFKMFKEYPIEAQIALRKINEGRGLRLLTS